MSTEVKRGFSREEAARYAGVSFYKIAKAIRDNKLPAHKDAENSKDIIVFREDLDAYMDSWGAA
jgi:excisionase family DNA binding protein